MYETFYGFSGIPFLLTPDSRFFFGSSGHSRAMSHLVYGLAQEEGFIVITGEVGAGKTTLVEQLWSRLSRDTYVMARVVTTQVSGDDMLRLAMADFGLEEDPAAGKAALLRRFEQMVGEQRQAGRASVQTILLGQPQFRPILARPDLEQLRQRVLASYHLGPLTEAETRSYIEHRLKTVGWNGDPRWEDAAFTYVYRHTGGIPRRINTLCSRILLYGALEEAHVITGPMVEMTAGELNQDLGAGLAPAPRPGAYAGGTPSLNAPDTLLRRVEALEQGAARQERVFRRVLDLLGAAQDRAS